MDLSELAGVERAAAEALARFGRLDVLVNNAGAIKGGDFLTTPDEEWMKGWSLKLLGYIRMARAVFPAMQKQGGGRIVNVVGMAARNPATTYMMGGAANAALINFTKALADLGARSNILVTAVSPGPVRTDPWAASRCPRRSEIWSASWPRRGPPSSAASRSPSTGR